jgi:hypothetical protein
MATFAEKIGAELNAEFIGNFRFLEDGTLILFFGPSSISDSTRKRLWIETTWRLRDANSIRIGSFDAPNKIVHELASLIGLAVGFIEVDGITGDLKLRFADGPWIETFGYSADYDLWEYRRYDGLRLGIGANYQPYERFEPPD